MIQWHAILYQPMSFEEPDGGAPRVLGVGPVLTELKERVERHAASFAVSDLSWLKYDGEDAFGDGDGATYYVITEVKDDTPDRPLEELLAG